MILSITIAALAGCAKERALDLRGEGFQADATLDQKYRSAKSSAEDSNQKTGFSTKAREIESRLGVD